MSTDQWRDIFSQAAALGVLHVHLSGGEPASRRDLRELVAHCAKEGLYTNLITSGVGLTRKLSANWRRPASTMCNCQFRTPSRKAPTGSAAMKDGFAKKMEVAAWVAEEGLPLTVNAVIHRANVARAARHGGFRGPRSARDRSKSPTPNITAGRCLTALI